MSFLPLLDYGADPAAANDDGPTTTHTSMPSFKLDGFEPEFAEHSSAASILHAPRSSHHKRPATPAARDGTYRVSQAMPASHPVRRVPQAAGGCGWGFRRRWRAGVSAGRADLVASPALSRARASLSIALVFCDQLLLRSQRPQQRRRLAPRGHTRALTRRSTNRHAGVCLCCVQPRRCLVRHRRLRRCRAVRR